VSAGSSYSAPKERQRGAFRYLNVYHNSTGAVEVHNLSIHFTPIPEVGDDKLGAYTGYFHSNDEKLNRVWYAGAYTNELCTIDPTAGNALTLAGSVTSNDRINEPLPWYYNATISSKFLDLKLSSTDAGRRQQCAG
jgi:hypothetical protein